MRCRAVTEDGDLLPVTHPDDMDMDTYAVSDSIMARLRLLYGEWFEDEEIGFRVPRFLYDGVKKPIGSGFLSSYVAEYIKNTQGVTGVEIAQTEPDKRSVALDATVSTVYGTQVETEVNHNVLLQAVY